jgi:hypothetical protein
MDTPLGCRDRWKPPATPKKAPPQRAGLQVVDSRSGLCRPRLSSVQPGITWSQPSLRRPNPTRLFKEIEARSLDRSHIVQRAGAVEALIGVDAVRSGRDFRHAVEIVRLCLRAKRAPDAGLPCQQGHAAQSQWQPLPRGFHKRPVHRGACAMNIRWITSHQGGRDNAHSHHHAFDGFARHQRRSGRFTPTEGHRPR